MAVSSPGEAETLRAVECLASDALPPGWSLRARRGAKGRRGRVATKWTVYSPDGTAATFVVEVKRSILGRDVDDVLARLATYGDPPIVAAPYLGATLRRSLADRGVSFIDTTGNLRLVAGRPGLFVERQGATKDPWPSDDMLQSLRGRAAGRAVRALVDFRPPYGVRDLAKQASVPLGSLSRTLDLLDREGFVTRDGRGAVVALDWEATIRRWTRDYEFARSNRISSYLEPRGLGAVASKLGEVKWPYAVTGAFAAQRFTPIAPARQAAIYVEDATEVAERLKLRSADAGANVVLAEPFDPVVFERSAVREGIEVVATAQLVADLLTGSGREPSEGNELLSRMRAHEDAWRV
ncbi:MAG: type IV toxin-antitoxin system AbiEi family antitoxin [Acidimicrobiales bacterium]